MATLERYGTAKDFTMTFTPDRQVAYSRHTERCHTGQAPELDVVAEAYGGEVADAWLAGQLHDLNEYVGGNTMMSLERCKETAAVMRRKFGFLKVTEIMLFLVDYKGGVYGETYGGIDGIKLNTALGKFCNGTRRKRLEEYECRREEARKAAERERQAAGAITMEAYERSVQHTPTWRLRADRHGGRR